MNGKESKTENLSFNEKLILRDVKKRRRSKYIKDKIDKILHPSEEDVMSPNKKTMFEVEKDIKKMREDVIKDGSFDSTKFKQVVDKLKKIGENSIKKTQKPS